MFKSIKKSIKIIGKKLGYTVLSNENYLGLKNKPTIDFDPTGKNNLLKNFFHVLINEGYFPEVIYDIGANKGSWTKECLKYFPEATYYLFEPQKELEKDVNLLLGHLENIHLFSVGVGKEDEIKNFTIHSRDDSCSYSYSPEEANIKGFKQLKLKIVKLDTFVKENNLKAPSVLKIDAEGLDLEVLQGANSLLSKIDVIMIEVGVMNKRIQNSALETINYLDKNGFRLFDITDINRPFPNQVLWLCEFVFIRKNGILDKEY